MSWLFKTIDERIEDIQDKIDELLVEMAGVASEHDTIYNACEGQTINYFIVEDIARLKRKHSELKQEVACLQVKRDGLVAKKQMKQALKNG